MAGTPSRGGQHSGKDIVSLRVRHAGDLRVGERRRLIVGEAGNRGSREGVDLVGREGRDLLCAKARHFVRG